MIKQRRPHLKRHPERHRVPKTVKERKNAEQPISGARIYRLNDRLGIGRQVAVRQHHALGIAGAPAGEDDGCQVVGSVRAKLEDPTVQDERRQKDNRQERAESLPRRNLFAEVLEINQLDAWSLERQL